MIKTKQLLLIFIPAILLVMLVFFVRIIQYNPLNPSAAEYEKIKPTSFNIPLNLEDPIIGNKNTGTTLVVFGDFGCPTCQAQHELLKELITKYPTKVKVIWKGLSRTVYPASTELAHNYAYCANKQKKFNEFAETAFVNGDNLNKEVLDLIAVNINLDSKKLTDCLASAEPKNYLQKNEQLAMLLNIQALPTIFFNNKQIQAPQLLEGWETLLKL
ncbi:MAG: DSBA oxidoreductase [Candidatus Magasanikbacteria bacterium GW2011_GWC2_37_14]|uniref:DSBA oxidoreductase n=1 Tax=Candidatus Magasanikbacteria bacterium GW2011_GWC2_37_14 TaxID=1619046 RepID=A0A0G0GNY0_9BACT|nr:MAG: DSBA oxidoreductase [Candidatus Magasanikbacteria bacterium GW2011_GWC2_37_14]